MIRAENGLRWRKICKKATIFKPAEYRGWDACDDGPAEKAEPTERSLYSPLSAAWQTALLI